VIALALLFVNLGFWQLSRADERALDNAVKSARLSSEMIGLNLALEAAGDDTASLEYRPVEVVGTFRPDLEVLVRNQTNNGQAGFHVVTPLETEPDTYVLVNRGWVPLAMDSPPVAATPPGGATVVDGLVRLTQLRPSVGPVEPEGELAVASRIDLDRLARQIPGELLPVWVQSTESTELPVPVALPDVEDPGPHIMYAIQWFAFAVIGVVGFVFLVRGQITGRDENQRVE
jgi:surfeit locus 1 family protein